MGRSNVLCFSLNVSFNLFFCLFIFNITASSQNLSNPLQDDPCEGVNCGQGTCVPSNSSFLLPFDCVCSPGWKKVQLGLLTLLSPCILPNCTVDLQCGMGAPPPPPPPQFNLSNPCSLVWCGDGNCVVDGTGYHCQCNEGSSNFMDLPNVACFKPCALGADCKGVSIGQSKGPPPSDFAPPEKGSNDSVNTWGKLQALIIAVSSVIFLTWI